MKRLLMGFAACALIMTSCSQQEIIETAEDGQGLLSFSAGVGKQSLTRAAEFNNTALQEAAVGDNGIIINAYQNITSAWSKWYIDEMVYTGGIWKLGSVRFRNENPTKYITYFSKTDKLVEVKDGAESTFVTADFTDKFPQFTYTVADNSASQEDLIAGITEVDAKKTDITLGMRHILSQVNFGAVAYKGANIQIQNIKIVGVGNKADFTYGAANSYPIGAWSTLAEADKTIDYEYYNYSNEATGVAHTTVPATATSGAKYIFGDGGNWGPGKGAETHYPVGTTGNWQIYDKENPQTGLKNSLMLLPQELGKTAKVTFEYKIQDVDGAYAAGNVDKWAKGEFSLDFSTGTESGKHYNSKWEQNYRYVYLIDFTDFLDGITLTFDVDVDMYPWENYDGDEGIIDIMAAGQPTQADMNKIEKSENWYIASQSTTAPGTYNPIKWAQVVSDEIWDLSAYDFKNIGIGKTFTLNFQNVIFNTKKDAPNPNVPTTITMTLPDGFSVVIPGATTNIMVTTHSSQSNTWIISEGDRSKSAAITITNDRYYRNSAGLKTGIEAANTNNLRFGYSGTDAIDLTTMQPTNQTTAKSLTVKFNCTITPTVGATTNGIWTYNTATKTATWTNVTWNNLNDAKAAVADAEAKTVIYCSDAADIALNTALGEPANSPVSVVFSTAAARTAGNTTNGAWTYTPATKTATWVKKTNP